MEAIRNILYKNKEILIVDYSDCKTNRMFEIFDTAKKLILTDGKPVLVLNIFSRNYVTPDFMRHIEKEVKAIESLIDRNSIIGLTEIQKWILKGMNVWYKRQLYYFATKEEALEFLVASEDSGKTSAP